MRRILITGMSGTGKSTVLAELGRRGHRVVDADDDGWAEEVPLADGSGWEQRWNEARMSDLLAEEGDGTLFVSGCAANQVKFYGRFDAVVLLSTTRQVLLERLMTRTEKHFGKDPAETERILEDLTTVEPLLRRSATIEIDTNGPLRSLVDSVEALGLPR